MEQGKPFDDFVAACQAVRHRSDLREAGARLKAVLAHDMFSCTLVHLADLQVVDTLNLGFPTDEFDAMHVPQQGSRCPAVRLWAERRQPVSLRYDGGDTEVALHGVTDIDDRNACLFTVARGLPWSGADLGALERAVPHLHYALSRAADFGNKRPRGPLTQREQQVLQWVCSGKSNMEIASILGISTWTVKIHISHLLAKLNASNRSHAVAKAISFNMVTV